MNTAATESRIQEYSKGRQLLFDDFQIPMEFPEVEVCATVELCRDYLKALGEPSEWDKTSTVPPSIVCLYGTPTVIFSGFDPRVIPPPGNIHYRQEYSFLKPIVPGERLIIRSTALNKEIIRDKKYITIESKYMDSNGSPVAIGRITVVWAK